ncbi:MAG: winged helix-turn-helix transcriptional regulator [Bdellovibrionaceae bacterium]|nr:winged helix-turn-helix transcriptional regulator [Bdellovibrio sp.]
MAKTKSQVKNCVGRLRVLADETRLRVIHQIIDNPLIVNEINKVLKIVQSLLSHHLKVLRDAELVSSNRSGKSIRYSTITNVVSNPDSRIIDLGCCQINFKEKKV